VFFLCGASFAGRQDPLFLWAVSSPEKQNPMLDTALSAHTLLLDGAMATCLRERFGDPEEGVVDLLVLDHPERVEEVHREYLLAGADVIQTCTLNAQRLSLPGMPVREINRQAARMARQLADRFTRTTGRPRYVLGRVGPTFDRLSIGQGDRTRMQTAYREQMEVLLEEGVDALMLETCTDLENIRVAMDALRQLGVDARKRLIVSATVSREGRLLSGETMEMFADALLGEEERSPLAIGLNCGYGPTHMLPWLRELRKAVAGRCCVTCHPSASVGVDERVTDYLSKEDFATAMRPYFAEHLADMIGGCCGTTPAYTAELAKS